MTCVLRQNIDATLSSSIQTSMYILSNLTSEGASFGLSAGASSAALSDALSDIVSGRAAAVRLLEPRCFEAGAGGDATASSVDSEALFPFSAAPRVLRGSTASTAAAAAAVLSTCGTEAASVA